MTTKKARIAKFARLVLFCSGTALAGGGGYDGDCNGGSFLIGGAIVVGVLFLIGFLFAPPLPPPSEGNQDKKG